MEALQATPPTRLPPPNSYRIPPRPLLFAAAVALLALLLTGWYFADQYWPFRYRNVEPILESVLASKVTVKEYHRTYFPSPGFVAEGLVLRRNSAPGQPPVGTTGKLIVRGRWSDLLLLRYRIRLVDLVGLHVVIPPVGSAANHADFPPGSSADFAGPEPLIEELRFHHAQFDLQRVDGGLYTYPIENLVIRNLQRGRAIAYTVDMRSTAPSGHILSNGSFGPLNPNDLGATPVSGDFTFTQVQLSQIGKLHGVLNVSDHFEGTLAAISATATAAVSGFAVANGRPTALSSSIHCTVSALTGDIQLQAAELKTGASAVEARGTIQGPGAKTTNLDFTVTRGRVEDLLHPFLRGSAPLAGPVSLNGHATLLPAQNGDGFFKRLRMDATLAAPAEKITDPATEQSLTAFSQRAAGGKSNDEDPDAEVLSSISGHATLANGIASTRDLRVQFPGVSTTLAGTWNLHTTAAHLTGDLRMDTDLSHAATGYKSLLLKPLAPFFRRGKAGAVIPIAFTGTSGNYKISQDIIPIK